jgi:hypothetical protein
MARLRVVMIVAAAVLCMNASRAHAASLASALGVNQDVLDAQKAAALTVGRISNNIDIDIDITNTVTVGSGGSGGGSGQGGCSAPKFNHCGQPVFPKCSGSGGGGHGGGSGFNNVNIVINISIEIVIKFVTTSCSPPASPSRCCRCFGF